MIEFQNEEQSTFATIKVVGCGGGDLAAVMKSGATSAATSRTERVKALRDIYKIVSKAVDNKGLPKIVMVTAMVRHEEDLNAVLAFGFGEGLTFTEV